MDFIELRDWLHEQVGWLCTSDEVAELAWGVLVDLSVKCVLKKSRLRDTDERIRNGNWKLDFCWNSKNDKEEYLNIEFRPDGTWGYDACLWDGTNYVDISVNYGNVDNLPQEVIDFLTLDKE